MSDLEYDAVNEQARQTLWAGAKDVFDRAYANARQMGLEPDQASDYADEFYAERFGLEGDTPDFSAALVAVALNPELATPPAHIIPKPTLNETLETQFAAEYVAVDEVHEKVELPEPTPRENPTFVPATARERLQALSGRSVAIDAAVTAARLTALAHGIYTPESTAVAPRSLPEVGGLSL